MPSTSTTTASPRSPTAATCSTRCWISCVCGRATTGWPGTCGRCCWPTGCWCAAVAHEAARNLARGRRRADGAHRRGALRRFERLCKKYGMRLPSIAESLSERFVRPLEIDRLCALVRPAIDEIRERPRTGVAPPIGGRDCPFHPGARRRRFRIAALARGPGAGVGSCPVAVGRRRGRAHGPQRASAPGPPFPGEIEKQLRQMLGEGPSY